MEDDMEGEDDVEDVAMETVEAEAERGSGGFFVVMEIFSPAEVEGGSDDPGSDAERLIPIEGSGFSLPFPTDFEGREAGLEDREAGKVCAEFSEFAVELATKCP